MQHPMKALTAFCLIAAASAAATPQEQAPPSAAASATNAYQIVVSQRRLVSGPTVIRVHKNETVVLSVTSDQADELHLHGYDLHAKLAPGQAANLQFVAKRTGRFTYELHRSGLELGAIEIYP